MASYPVRQYYIEPQTRRKRNTMHTLHDHIVALSREAPDASARLSCTERGEVGRVITRSQLLLEIEAVAQALRGLGIKRGERVALAFDNSPEFLILSWAA